MDLVSAPCVFQVNELVAKEEKFLISLRHSDKMVLHCCYTLLQPHHPGLKARNVQTDLVSAASVEIVDSIPSSLRPTCAPWWYPALGTLRSWASLAAVALLRRSSGVSAGGLQRRGAAVQACQKIYRLICRGASPVWAPRVEAVELGVEGP
ncbi:hypothetical protein NDU88_000191 [Pleurodeles waltl]|uniref:Uncharacterized protein n=1 Tax=Pleurodeles waltl TaxID=8319 RepID=A0AAV7P060_PLEWA|nr:hypothetical protein NDU88_000191 [Pleurodeles waltl]